MRYLLIPVVLVTLAGAGMLDFMTLKEAKTAYEKGDYVKAANLYEKIARSGNDAAKLDAGDAWYKAGEYEKALQLYRSIRQKDLQFEKLHNMGNCYAHLGKIDEGIEAYEAALKIREDEDTRFNLELLKKMKEKKENKKDRKNDRQQQNKKNSDGGKNRKDDRQGEGQQNRQKSDEKSERNKSDEKSGKGKEDGKKDASRNRENRNEKARNGKEKKREEPDREKGTGASKTQNMPRKNDEPISEMELRKWNKVLNQRGIHTLMLPMPTKKSERSDDETTPW